MPHVATDSAVGVRWDLTRVFADGMPRGDALAGARGRRRGAGGGRRRRPPRSAPRSTPTTACVADRGRAPRRVGLRGAAPVGRPRRRRGARPRDRVDAVLERVRARLSARSSAATASCRTSARRRSAGRALPPLPGAAPGGARVPRSIRAPRPPSRPAATRASTAWRRLYDDTMTAISVPFDAGDGVEPHTLGALDALLFTADRDVRLRRHRRRLGRPSRDRRRRRRLPRRGDRRPPRRGPPARARRPDGRDAVHRPGGAAPTSRRC